MYKSLSQNEWESVRLVTSKKYTSKEYVFKTDLMLQNFNKLSLYFTICIQFYNIYSQSRIINIPRHVISQAYSSMLTR